MGEYLPGFNCSVFAIIKTKCAVYLAEGLKIMVKPVPSGSFRAI